MSRSETNRRKLLPRLRVGEARRGKGSSDSGLGRHKLDTSELGCAVELRAAHIKAGRGYEVTTHKQKFGSKRKDAISVLQQRLRRIKCQSRVVDKQVAALTRLVCIKTVAAPKIEQFLKVRPPGRICSSVLNSNNFRSL